MYQAAEVLGEMSYLKASKQLGVLRTTIETKANKVKKSQTR